MKNASSRSLIRAALLAVFMCALPALAGEDIYGLGNGHNGSPTFGSGNNTINLYARVNFPAAPGDTFIKVASNPGIVAGDLILIIQTTGIVPEPPSGASGPIDLSNDPVGRWELARVTSVSSSTTLNMDQPLLYSYAATVTQVVRVPEYVDLTVNGTGAIIAPAWNASNGTGGIIAFLAQGNVTVNATISVTSKGFHGGGIVRDTSGITACSGLDQPAPTGAQKGEGIAVTRYSPTPSTGLGRVANAGGGGVCLNSGGGGGGNGGAGGAGGNSQDSNRAVGGQGGTALNASVLTRLTLGGGGGPGHITELGDADGRSGRRHHLHPRQEPHGHGLHPGRRFLLRRHHHGRGGWRRRWRHHLHALPRDFVVHAQQSPCGGRARR